MLPSAVLLPQWAHRAPAHRCVGCAASRVASYLCHNGVEQSNYDTLVHRHGQSSRLRQSGRSSQPHLLTAVVERFRLLLRCLLFSRRLILLLLPEYCLWPQDKRSGAEHLVEAHTMNRQLGL